MDNKEFQEVLSNYVKQLLDGEPERELKLKYYNKLQDFNNDQLEELMFYDFMVKEHQDIVRSGMAPKAEAHKSALLITALMRSAWDARANFHSFVARNEKIELKKHLDVCMN